MLRRTLPGPLSSVPAHRTPHAATAEMWGGQARCTWLRQGRDGLRRSPRVRGRSGRRALSRRACRGWRDRRHEKRAEDGGVWSEGPGDRTRPRKGGKARTRQSGAAKGHPQLGKTVARRTRGEAARHVQGGKRGPWRSGRPGPMCTRQQRGSTAAHSTLTVEKTILQASGRCLADMPDKPPTRHAQRLLCRKKCLINPCDSILSGQMVV